MVKRNLMESIATDDPTLYIKVAQSEDKLPAHRGILEVASSCVKHLPVCDTWDLSLLSVNGAPVQRTVVVAWLEVVYLAAEHERQDDPVLLSDLLAFADAVGSTQRVLVACSKQVELDIAMPPQQEQQEQPAKPKWLLDGRGYYIIPRTAGHDLLYHTHSPSSITACMTDIVFPSNQASHDATLQLAQQLEGLLYQAYKLNLAELQQRLHQVLLSNSMYQHSVLNRKLLNEVVFSERVMTSLVGLQPTAIKDAYIDSMMQRPCNFEGQAPLFQLDEDDELPEYVANVPVTMTGEVLGCTAPVQGDLKLSLLRLSVLEEQRAHQILPMRLVLMAAGHSQAASWEEEPPEELHG